MLKNKFKKVMATVIPIMIIGTSTSLNGVTAYSAVSTSTVATGTASASIATVSTVLTGTASASTSTASVVATGTASASTQTTYTDNQGITYNLDNTNKTASVSEVNSKDIKTADIPAEVITNGQKYSVTSIVDNAFWGCSSLTSITIPGSVTSIGNYFFPTCSSLTNINVDDNNKNYSSEGGILFNKEKTELICYPKGNNQSSYIIPSSVTSINMHGFCGNSSLISVTIPSGVTSIGIWAFLGCSSLTSITIPSSVTSIGSNALEGCSSLVSINVDDKNENFSSEDGVLFNKDKTNLIWYPKGNNQSSYIIPSSVTSIWDWAFSYCSSLASITIPSSVTSISINAFSGCSRLTSISIPSSVTSIGVGTFSYCNILTSINIDDNNKNYSSEDGVLFNKDKTELIRYPEGNNQTSYIIPNSVTSIDADAFYGCSSLESITIPSSLTWIGWRAFDSCNCLTSINVDDNNKNYSSEGGVLFNKDKTNLIRYPEGNNQSSYTIPSSVTSIDNSAFNDCSRLTSMNVDDNNKNYSSEGEVLFNKDKTELIRYPEGKNQSSYTIPNSVTSIEFSAFWGCNSLTNITIPSSVTSIGTTKEGRCNYLNGELGGGTILTSDGKSINNAFQTDDGVVFYRTIATGASTTTQASIATTSQDATITTSAGTTTQVATNTQVSTGTVAQETTTATGTSTGTVATGTTSQTTKTGDGSVLPVIAAFILGSLGIAAFKRKNMIKE